MADEDSKIQSSSDIAVMGSADAPAIFIDGYQSATLANGVVRLRLVLTTTKDDGEGSFNKVVGFLIMGLPTLHSLHTSLGELIDKIDQPDESGEVEPSEKG